jgi:hypothetical protein
MLRIHLSTPNTFEPKEQYEHFHTNHSLGDCYDVYLSFGSIYCAEHLEFGLVVVPQDEQSMPGYVQIQGNFIYFEVPDLDLDSAPDPNPALFVNGFQDANKK